MRLGPMLDPLLTADIISTAAGRLPPSSERPTRPKVIDSLSLISRRPSRMPARGHVLWGRSGWSASRVRLGKSLGGVLLAQILNVRFWQSLDVRFFEAAEQHAEASATRPWAKPVGCKQPTGTATALTRRGSAAARKRCPADAYTIARSLGGLCPICV